MDKQELIKKLEAKNSKFYEETINEVYKSINSQIDKNGNLITETKLENKLRGILTYLNKLEKSPEYKHIHNVLINIKTENPTRVSNVNTNDFPAYNFLKTLLDYSQKQYSDGNFKTVANYLTAKNENTINTKIIGDLVNSFENRGLMSIKGKHDVSSISKTMTVDRVNYLTELANEFEKNKYSSKVIEFLNLIPTYLDENTKELKLPCDNTYQFKELKKQYVDSQIKLLKN